MTTNYNINNVDLDESPYNFSSYINASDGNYTNTNVINVTARKTVVFGQNALTNVHPIGNLGNAFNTAQGVNIPKIDIDKVSVVAALPTAVIFSDTTKSQYYIRGNFALVENNPNITATLEGLTNRVIPQYVGGNLAGDSSVWTKIFAGGSNTTGYSFLIQSNGTLWGCGYNSSNGYLGVGDRIDRSSPTQVQSSVWKEISNPQRATLGIQSNGTLWAWGGNNNNGMLGLGDTTLRSTPTQVGSLSVWTKISATAFHSLALQSNGTLWSWGANNNGQLGSSNTTDRSSPVQVGTLSVWTAISASGGVNGSSFAIQSNGTLWAWGHNQNQGTLGLSDTVNRSSPVQVGTLSVWTKISCSSLHALAIQSDGTLWSWGNNGDGQLGSSNTTDRSSPVQVGTLSVWTAISTGERYSLAIQSNGTLWAWGNNTAGQLGLSDLTARSSPVQVGTESYWTQISTGATHTLALQSNSILWAWGRNNFGQLGDSIIFTNPQKPNYGL